MFNSFSQLMTLHVVHEEICCLFQRGDCTYDISQKDDFATCSDIISSIIMLNVTGLILNVKQ